jgi:putative sterol carrier protein
MWTSETQAYEGVLQDFKDRFNGNPRAQKLVKDWDRIVLLDSTDTGAKFGLVVKDQVMLEVRSMQDADEEAEGVVHLQAEQDVLQQIFAGRYNPATALVDGALAVYSADRDKVKLEALAMVIWRLG